MSQHELPRRKAESAALQTWEQNRALLIAIFHLLGEREEITFTPEEWSQAAKKIDTHGLKFEPSQDTNTLTVKIVENPKVEVPQIALG